jgi:hypothetical protein
MGTTSAGVPPPRKRRASSAARVDLPEPGAPASATSTRGLRVRRAATRSASAVT